MVVCWLPVYQGMCLSKLLLSSNVLITRSTHDVSKQTLVADKLVGLQTYQPAKVTLSGNDLIVQHAFS
jgi:hypothetical protein